MASPNINVLMSLVDKFSAPMRNVQNATKATTKELKLATNAVNNFADSAKNRLASATQAIVGATSGAMAGILAYSTKVGMDFEAAMSKVKAISGATGNDFQALTDKAKQLGSTTAMSASQVAEAMKYMAMAGWNPQQITSGIEGLVNLAIASGEELGTVSDIVTDAMTAFHMSADEVGRFGDVLSTTATNSNTNVAMMGETFKECSALAGTMGYTIEDTALAIGLMANAGIKGSTAGTAIKNAITNMASPTKSMQEAMTALNLSLSDGEGNMKSFKTVLIEMRAAFAGLTKEEQAKYASDLFGKESMAGMLSVINASTDDWNKLSNAIDNASGSTKKMADTMSDNLQGQVNSFKSVLEGMGISIYDKFKVPLTNAFKSVNESLQNLADQISNGDLGSRLDGLGNSIGKLVEGLGSALVTVLPMIITLFTTIIDNANILIPLLAGIAVGMKVFAIASAIQAFAGGLELATIAMAVFNAVCALNPLGLLAIAIGVVVALIVALYMNFDELSNHALFLWNTISQVFTDAGTAIGAFVTTAMGLLGRFASWIAGAFVDMVVGAFNGIKSTLGGIIDKAREAIGLSSQASNGGSTPHNATGSSFFRGGMTYVNENNRGELINLPSGSQIIPHDLSQQLIGGGRGDININLNIAGNVIGNEDFYNECGEAITSKLRLALANM